MKKVFGLLAGSFLIFLIAGSAAALPITWEDSLAFNPDEKISMFNGGYSFFFDLRNDGYLAGIEIDDYTLSINVYDDGSGWLETDSETVMITTLGGVTIADVAMGYVEQDWGIFGVLDLEDDGTLNVWVASLMGDFYLDSASLIAHGDDGTVAPPKNPVPEPASLILLGAGLLGLAGIARKKM